MKLSRGYSNWHSSISVNPSDLQVAFDAGFSTLGNAWRNRCVFCDLATVIASVAALVAIPRPWNAGSTDHPSS